MTHLGVHLPNWSHMPLPDKESGPPKTCTPQGRYGLFLRKAWGIDAQQMVGPCILPNCCKT